MHGSYLARFVIRWTCPALAAALLGLVSAPVTGGVAQNAVPGAREPVRVDAGAVNAAIDKAKAYLYSKQSPDGTWELAPAPKAPDSEDSRGLAAQSESIGQWGGRTALCVYALLAAGESPQEEKLARAVTFIKTAELTGTYALGVRLMALRYLPMDEPIRNTVQRDAQLLLRTVKTEGDAAGHYDYNAFVREDNRSFSHSRSQYGVLGVWAAARMGYEVDPRYWQLVDAGWRRNQKPTGGWNYNTYTPGAHQEESPGMTAAGVASLMITNEFLLGGRGAGTNGNIVDPSIDAGLAWLAQNFQKIDPEERFRDVWAYITVYNLERLSVAGGLRYVGEHDWYATIANWLLRDQRRDGSWRRRGGGGQGAEVVDTAFALLFLGRGRSPVVAAKLAHVSVDRRGQARKPDWHQRPRDLANLAEYTGQGLEREVHWQILDPGRPVEEWLDAPVLYVSGSMPLALADDIKQRLREYIEQGGLIVFNADGGRKPFADSVVALARELFPSYSFRFLEPDHPIFNLQYALSKGRRLPRIQGLSNGARELMLLVPTNDLGREWQTQREETSMQVGANIYAYAVDRTGMRYKGDRHTVEKRTDRQPRHEAVVGRLKYDGNWNPEPAGWQRLAAVMHNQYDTALTVREVDAVTGELGGIDVLHLTGTAEFTLPEEARARIRTFISDGGTLLVDAAGGSGAFASSAERELREIAGEEAAAALTQPLAAESVLYSNDRGLPELKVAYRLDADLRLGAPRSPRLRAVEQDGRLAILWSPEDLTVGLVGMPVAGVIGYAPETATALVARIICESAE